jgi:hypothetical protein
VSEDLVEQFLPIYDVCDGSPLPWRPTAKSPGRLFSMSICCDSVAKQRWLVYSARSGYCRNSSAISSTGSVRPSLVTGSPLRGRTDCAHRPSESVSAARRGPALDRQIAGMPGGVIDPEQVHSMGWYPALFSGRLPRRTGTFRAYAVAIFESAQSIRVASLMTSRA